MIPADLLEPEPGWTGPTPHSAGDFTDAAAAEKRGREAANLKLAAIKRIDDEARAASTDRR